MYFTRFPINVTRRETRSMLANPYRLHAAIAGCFPPGEREEEGRVLWRIDSDNQNHRWLYVVSPGVPSLVGIDEQMGWPDLPHQWETKSYDAFLAGISNGQKFRFRLVANPTVSRSGIKNGGGQSKRIPHLTALQQTAWLAGKAAYEGTGKEVPAHIEKESCSRAQRNGFAICKSQDGATLDLVVSDLHRRSFRQGGKDRTITLTTARYDGLLEVCDADALRHALVCGIGRGKSFGCGLLTLVPVSS